MSKLYVDELHPKTSSDYVTLKKPILFQAIMTTAQTVSTSHTVATFNTPTIDTAGAWDATNDKYVIPKKGYYRFVWSLNTSSSNVESRYVAARLSKNGTYVAQCHSQMASASGASDYTLNSAEYIALCDVDDEFQLKHNAAVSGLSVNEHYSHLGIQYLGDD